MRQLRWRRPRHACWSSRSHWRPRRIAGATIVATVDTAAEFEGRRIAELEQRLQEAERQLIAFQATAVPESGRKTAAAGAATMLAKQEGDGATFSAAAVDGALATLSIEQRIAVKAELLRAGLIG